MEPSVATGMKVYYGDVTDTPVDITDFVMTIGDVTLSNVLAPSDGFNAPMPKFIPTGRGSFAPVDVGGIYKTGTGSIDALFANRIPEGVDAIPRTLTMQYMTGRTMSVKTHLKDFKRSANKDNGVTKYTITLQPHDIVTELIP